MRKLGLRIFMHAHNGAAFFGKRRLLAAHIENRHFLGKLVELLVQSRAFRIDRLKLQQRRDLLLGYLH